MLKTAFATLLALVVAVVGGGGSVWYALKAQEGVGAVTVGGWTAFPDIGTPQADPYSKARVAREGVLALGRAEGLAFSAQRDSAGDGLRRECAYKIEGSTPSARFWTLHAVDPAGNVIASGNLRAPALHSYGVIRNPDNSIAVSVSSRPSPGNWLSVSGSGPMNFVLTFYDTPIAASTGVDNIELPQVIALGCHG